jgi:hypothetical protein
MSFTLDEARDHFRLGKPEPRGTGQVIIREYTANRWAEVRIGRYRSRRKYPYYRITRAGLGVELPDFKSFSEALKVAIEHAEKQVRKLPAEPLSVTLTGSNFQVWNRLNEFCERHNVELSELPEVLGGLSFQIQILNK